MRIVSLCPSLTELVFDLGRGQELVGRTKFCVHPVDRVERIESVGGTKNPKIARIVELAPDLVLLNEEENRREDAQALAAAGLRLHVSFPRDVRETAGMVRDIGSALGTPAEAERIAADIERRAARVRERTRNTPPVRYAYLIWRNPWMVAGGDTFVTAMLALPGGVNVFADHPERYPVVAAEDLTAADPDAVLFSSEPFPFQEKHAEELAALTGLPRERMWFVDGEYLTWHGSRTPDGIDYAERVMADGRAGWTHALPSGRRSNGGNGAREGR
jgi:ABC-type Fe3+-hydroxamate transport system substrate-binding protein